MIKFKLFSRLMIAATLVFFAACDKNDTADNSPKNTGMVDFTVKTSIPQTILTYASGDGGAKNVESSKYALRYIMEAWTKNTNERAYRGYKIVPDKFDNTPVNFDVRLLAIEYNFVFWADFVEAGTTEETAAGADLFYATSDGLKNITIKTDVKPYGVSSDARDAYFANTNINLGNSNQVTSIELKRPFGKYHVIATDELNGRPLSKAQVPSTKIKYTGKIPAGFNAFAGEVLTDEIELTESYTTEVAEEPDFEIGGKPYPNALVLGFDYIFADADNTTIVNFEIDIFDGQSGKIGKTRELSKIPVKRNALTTVYGNLVSGQKGFRVWVGDKFAPDEVIYGMPLEDVEKYIDLLDIDNIEEFVAGVESGEIVVYGATEIKDNSAVKAAIISPNNIEDTGYGKNVGTYAFGDCKNLETLIVIDGVTSIDYGAFMNCTSLTEVTLPPTVKTIDGGAFLGCSNLETVDLKNGLTEIGSQAFGACFKLTNIDIPETVETIGELAFDNCYALTELTIPGSVTTIGKQAIIGSHITTINMTAATTNVHNEAFNYCDFLKTINYDGSEDDWNKLGIDEIQAEGDITVTVKFSQGGEKKYTNI